VSTIDRADPADMVGIAELLLRCTPDCVPLSPDQVRARLEDMFVARSESGEVVGCAALAESRLGQQVCSVAVAPSERGTGLGRRLVSAVLANAIGTVSCVTRNPEFFAGLGFEICVQSVPGSSVFADHGPRFVMRGSFSSQSNQTGTQCKRVCNSPSALTA